MKKTIALLVAAALLLPACSFNRTSVTNRSTDIAARMEDSAVLLRMKVQKTLHDEDTGETKVKTGWGSCSGVYVKENVILTAAHCVDLTEEDLVLKEIWVRKNEVSEKAVIIRVDPQVDLALLYTPLSGVPVRLAHRVIRGEDVWVIGNPLGLRDVITKGIVSQTNLQPEGIKATWLLVDAMSFPGNSGGPIVDSNGHLVAILTRGTSMLGFLGSSGLGIGVDLDTIKAFLKNK